MDKIPTDLQKRIARYLVHQRRDVPSTERRPEETFLRYLRQLQRSHEVKEKVIQSIPILPKIIQDSRVWRMTGNQEIPTHIYRIRDELEDIFGYGSMDYLRAHVYSKKMFVGMFIRYFESYVCFLYRNPRKIILSIYEGKSPSTSNLLDQYLEGSEQTFQKEVFKAIRLSTLQLVYVIDLHG